jgi:hypothetical protein
MRAPGWSRASGSRLRVLLVLLLLLLVLLLIVFPYGSFALHRGIEGAALLSE